jgi:hypothetical protein
MRRVLIDSDAELVDQLWNSNDPADVARLEAQARLIAAYEEMKWSRRPPSVADLIRHLDVSARPLASGPRPAARHSKPRE